MDLSKFRYPPHEFGEVSFFWWQGDPVTKEKLIWILDQLVNHHICGLQINYAHGDSGGRSYGLTLPSEPKPLSEEWWELIKWFAGEANKRGMSISLSDYTLGAPGQESYTDAVLSARPEFTGQILVKVKAGEQPEIEHSGMRILHQTQDAYIAALSIPFSMNPMAPGVGDAIASAFYGEFERRLPGLCGSGVNYFFSDELAFNVRGLLWSDEFAHEFTARKGYDLIPHLPDLFNDVDAFSVKTRLDYYDVVVELSESGYFKPIYDWHQSRGMTFGCDHGGRGRDVAEFGDYFRTMRWNQAPGNDQPHLASDIIKNKVNSSISHLYERPRTWLEGFYGSGWQTTSANVADAVFRNFALGHNLLSLHGLYYSTHGSMWEWAPPCNHHHMPYWADMGELLLCSKRLSWLLTQGKHVCDVAIVYPVAAVEADAKRGREAVQCAFAIGEQLYSQGIDFDFIDFQSIESGHIANGNLMVAGECYRTIVVPNMQAVRFGMMERLSEFARNGGHVAIIGSAPLDSDKQGRNDANLRGLLDEILLHQPILKDADDLIASMRQRYLPDIVLPPLEEQPFFQHRVIGNEHLYFLYNVPEGVKLGFRAKGTPYMLDPFGGDIYEVTSSEIKQNHVYVEVDKRFGGVMIVLFGERMPNAKPLYEGSYHDIRFEGEWDCVLVPTMDNRYGDYRLPAFEGCLSAEAREFMYREEGKQEWKTSIYGQGTYFHLYRGAADEQELRYLNEPDERFKPYRFSMKTGLEGDAGYQGSYHGLKGRISDDFIALGEKATRYSGGPSIYEGEGPYYLLTNVVMETVGEVRFLTGKQAPDKVWIDHTEIELEPMELGAGIHPLLLKYERGTRTYFIVEKAPAMPFEQPYPLAMTWFRNPNIIPFDAEPGSSGKVFEFRFPIPPAMHALILPAGCRGVVHANGKPAKRVDNRVFIEKPSPRCAEGFMTIQANAGQYDTALIEEPIQFECATGRINVDLPIEEQGLKYYSGGIHYSKGVHVAEEIVNTGKRVRFVLGELDCSAKVAINGKRAGTLVTSPYELDVTEFIHAGTNQFEVTIHNSLNNHMRTLPTDYRFERETRAK